jgi:hypothetical protein
MLSVDLYNKGKMKLCKDIFAELYFVISQILKITSRKLMIISRVFMLISRKIEIYSQVDTHRQINNPARTP